MGLTKEAQDLLETRYPNLAFLIRILGEGKEKLSLPSDTFRLPSQQKLRDVSVFYVYGLGHGEVYCHLKEWLAADRQRDLVFLEEDIEVLRHFLSARGAFDLLADPQVHIRFNMDLSRLDDFLKECAADYPVEKVEVMALDAYKQKFRSRFYRMRLKLMRYTTTQHALFVESLHYNLFFKNYLPNFRRFPGAFFGNHLKDRFEGVPAVICGAGPSLGKDLETLRGLENQALILAGGSAITALSHQGILPHLGVAIDPNFEEYFRFKYSSAFEVPLLYVNRLHPRIFQTCNGPRGYLHSLTGGMSEMWMEEKLNISQEPLQEGFDIEAMSVTTTCIQLAATMGCSPFILLGVDLAFTDKQSYVSGVVSDTSVFFDQRKAETRVSEKLLKRQDIYGKPIYTLVKWIMESASISGFAKHNKTLKMINATSGGIGFKGIPNQPLASIPFSGSYDLRGKLHHEMQRLELSVKEEDVESALHLLKASLKKAASYTEDALGELRQVQGHNRDPETGKIIFCQMELETLEAYTCFLKEPDHTFHFVLNRKYRPSTWNASEFEKNKLKWNYLYSKWSSFKHLIEFYLGLLPQSAT